jgi:hypothetical protein
MGGGGLFRCTINVSLVPKSTGKSGALEHKLFLIALKINNSKCIDYKLIF